MTSHAADFVLVSRNTALRAVTPGDYASLYQYATNGKSALTWRLRGRSVSPDAFPSLIWTDCLCQFVIAPRISPWSCGGLVSVFNHDPVNGTAYLSMLLSENLAGATPIAAETVLLVVRHVLRAFGMRKLYVESTTFAVPELDRLTERFESITEEGRLRDHLRLDDEWWDLVVLAIYVDPFVEESLCFERYLALTDRPKVFSEPSFDEFCEVLLRTLDLPLDTAVVGASLLREELGVGSLQLLDCFVAIEERWGLRPADDAVASVQSVQDLYVLVSPDKS